MHPENSALHYLRKENIKFTGMEKRPDLNKLNRFLNDPLINVAGVAYKLYPNIKELSAKSKFYHKLAGTNGRRFSEKEQTRILEIYEELKKRIEQKG